MAGEEITLPHGVGADNNEEAIRIDSMTGNQGKEELRQLSVELGLREEALEEGEGGLVVPRDKWHLLSERFPPDGATRLMLAAKRGERDCVHFLLRCGANVDDLDMRQKNALDYAVEHPEITLLLLQWDSLITVGDHRGDREKVWMTDPLIKPFLEKRDAFHRLLREEDDIKEIETFYNSHRDSMLVKDKRRRWVNTEGKSAL
ncbi:uncharacterized protein LOC124172384 isoform X2 [Ischnura elegans]|uniref:uncharacterized protein LOC124172384 isoform X2 n=1 Tax=Ischnura elegans TaxID=197161 RepID=UPI001ED89E6A|nr:uncharacterized protein LOC124172384 isoform X2 [Ischnura elegans]